jgi:hypothetical protein
MKKRTLSAALAAALVFSAAVPSVSVAAMNGEAVPYTYYRYASDMVYGDGQFWYPNLEAYHQLNPKNDPVYAVKPSVPYSEKNCYFDSENGYYVDESQTFRLGVYKITRADSTESKREYTAFLAGDGYYYPSLQLARNNTASNKTASINRVLRRGDGIYFSMVSGRFYTTNASALSASNGNARYIMLEVEGKHYDYRYTPVFRNSSNGKYYLSPEEAADANIKGKVLGSATSSQGYYFNRSSGRFYVYRDSAIAVSSINDVVKASSLAVSNGITSDVSNSEVPYYYDGVYNPSYTGTDNASAKAGDAYVYNNVTYAGWSGIISYIERRASGSVININMNQQVYVPDYFIEYIKNRGVTIVFIHENGARITLKGSDINKVNNVHIGVTYSTGNIPANTVRSLGKGAVSTSQFRLGDNSVYGFNANITVTFNKERAGKSVKLYYYDPITGKTAYMDTSTIAENGRAIFEVNRGGDFCAVIME